jgi:putative tryptophan/tyrosine transport system substrate-binding protein
MRRRAFITLLGGAAAWPSCARAQQPTARVRRIGFLSASWPSSPSASAIFETFRQVLPELGWSEGKDFIIDYRFAEGRFDRLVVLADELVRLNVDVIVAVPTAAAVAAKKATDMIPIVMINVGDPVGLRLVESLARPGGNVTGLAYSVGLETLGKGLELLMEAVPSVRRVGVLVNPANPAHAIVIRDLQAVSGSLGIELDVREIRGPDELEGIFSEIVRTGAGGLLVLPDVVTITYRSRVAELAAKHRLPSVHGFRESVEAGGLMSYGPSFFEQWRQAADFVDQILKGAKPAELPIKQPTQFEFIVNLKTARALGIEIPTSLLARADEVIE